MKKLLTLIFILSFLIVWEVASNNISSLNFFVSSPSQSVTFGFYNFQNILTSTYITALEALTGFCLAIVFSFIIMFFCLLHTPLLKMLLPLFITSQVLPIITLAPLFIVLFGMGIMSKIAMVLLMCFFPIFISFSSGVNSINQNIHEFLYIYNASKIWKIFNVIIPLSTPYIFNGLKVGATMATMGAVVSEFVGAKDGLGKNLYLAPKSSQPELMICSIIFTTLLGWTLYKAVDLSERIIGFWYVKNWA